MPLPIPVKIGMIFLPLSIKNAKPSTNKGKASAAKSNTVSTIAPNPSATFDIDLLNLPDDMECERSLTLSIAPSTAFFSGFSKCSNAAIPKPSNELPNKVIFPLRLSFIVSAIF